MAGKANVKIEVEVTGIGPDISVSNSKETTDVPIEAIQLNSIKIEDAQGSACVQLFDFVTAIALNKIIGVYLKCESGTLYVMVDTAGTSPVTAAAADILINAGEANYISLNPTSPGTLGMCIDAASSADKFSAVILAKA